MLKILENKIRILFVYGRRNGMAKLFNVDKCKIMHNSRNNINAINEMNCVKLEEVIEERNL